MANSESKFSSEIRSELVEVYGDNIFVHLIPDMRRTGKKPFDSYFIYKGMFCAMEFKRIDGHTLNIRNHIREHQPGCLQKVIDVGGVGVFVICFNDYKHTFVLTPKALKILEVERGISIKHDFFLPHVDIDNLVLIERKKIDGCTRWEVEKLIHVAERF